MRILASLIAVASLVWLARPAPAAGIPGPGGGPAADSGGLPALLPIRSQVVSDTLETPPAPLLVPGRPGPGDSLGPNRPGRAHEQYRLGRSLELAGSPAAAITAYRAAVRLDPTIPDANLRMGQLFLGRDQLEEAVKCFAAEVLHHPGNVSATRELGLALARLGQTRRAIAQLESLTRRRPNDGDCWQALGFAYVIAKRPRAAEIALRRAIVLPPPRADKHRDLGAVLAARGKEREAREQYQRAIALDSHDPTSWVNLGNLERRGGRLERALDDYREAERRDSSLALALQGEIETLRDLGRHDEAGAAYRRWLRVQPADHAARLEAVRFFDSIGRRDIGVEVARDGVRWNDRSGDAHLLLGMALASSGNPRAALGEIRKAESLFTTAPERARTRQLVAGLRAQAPDSLRELFAADSAEHAEEAR